MDAGERAVVGARMAGEELLADALEVWTASRAQELHALEPVAPASHELGRLVADGAAEIEHRLAADGRQGREGRRPFPPVELAPVLACEAHGR